MLLYLVRHGETECNVGRVIQGQSVGAHLTEAGVRQAELVGRRLRGVSFAAAYTSDLIRAVETAAGIARYTGAVFTREPLLRERCFGIGEGLSHEQLEMLYPSETTPWRADFSMAPPGGESYAGVIERSRCFIEGLHKHHSPSDTVLAVAHGGNMRGILLALLGLGTEHWRSFGFSNASLSIVELKPDTAVLKCFNDTAHLEAFSLEGGADVDNMTRSDYNMSPR